MTGKTIIDGKLAFGSEDVYLINNNAVFESPEGLVEGVKKALVRKKVLSVSKHGRVSSRSTVGSVMISLRLTKAPEEEPDDPVYLTDLLTASLPWKGICKITMEDGTVKWYDTFVRITVGISLGEMEDIYNFQLREIEDGKPDEGGLMVWDAKRVGNDTYIKTRHGFKQHDLIKEFSRYDEAVALLNEYLEEQGYIKLNKVGELGKWNLNWMLYFNEELVSNIDATIGSISRYTIDENQTDNQTLES